MPPALPLPPGARTHRLDLIGESRFATMQDGRLIAMHIVRDGDGLPAGCRIQARLTKKLGTRGIALAGSEELLVSPWPAGHSEGESLWLEITRAAWIEPGRERLAKARPARPARPHDPGRPPATPLAPAASGWPACVDDAWNNAFDAAELGVLPFSGGRLLFTPTPAFLAVDVDGAADALTMPALAMLAAAIRLWGAGGSIVIDLPAADRATRQQAVAAFDAGMAGMAFERTAINGFGLMQIVLPRPGPSVLERARLDRAGSDAVRLLHSAARDHGHGPLRLVARPAVAGWLEKRPHLLAALARACGRSATIRVDASASAGSGYVEPAD